MDVNTMVRTTMGMAQATQAYGAKGADKAKDVEKRQAAEEDAKAEKSEQSAYALDISTDAKEKAAAAQTPTAESVAQTEGKTHGDAVKGLSPEQVDVLKEGITKSYEIMIKTLTEQNAKLQGWLDDGIGKLNFGGILVDADRFALPAVGTTPEEAKAAISEGGAYSVNAVADRIFGLAEIIAGGDPEKLQKMRDAVEKGFEQAGLAWKDATGEDSMPQITKDTHNEINRRFDELYAKLTGQAPEDETTEQ
ncbi:MAG: hypothetical protein IJS96_03280 [Schwartzia sp.]|nr:hypothetical protein [Schwartzia sp. (in: firmicutes)]